MKSLTVSLILTISLTISVIAQNVTRLDPYDIQYEPDVILIKFKDDVEVPVKRKGTLGKWAPTGLLSLFQENGIDYGERLFPKAKPQTGLRKIKAYNGTEHEVGSLYNIFKFQLKDGIDPKDVADKLNEHKDVEYAEPDYIFSALETVPNDPLYSSQQWYLPVVNAPAAWDTTTGDTTQLIAIIDTGVDWDHADLDGKIKINWTEYNGAAGVDDDGNGKVDDIRGWDFVNNDNNPNDDNSHGTHVAGIAAAETNNGTGIAGVSWGAKILPVKVMQSTGYGSSSTIALGVTYAANSGATVLNLSLGSYSESLTLKTALENAYSTAVIVAAAGNDFKPIAGKFGKPMFPACYGWMIGVQANAGWSNYDPSGPVEYNNDYGYNYELTAPGTGIYSTIPNGQYRNLSGTSMSTPIVAGAAALLKTQQPSISTELLLGNMINSGTMLNIFAAMNQIPTPDLHYISYTLVDTLVGDDRDGRPDAGETIQLWPTVKNAWGQADSVWTKIRFGEFEDHTTAVILDSTSYIGNISPYANLTGEPDPFKIELSSNLAHARDVVFEIEIGCRNSATRTKQNITITVENGVDIAGVLTNDTTWTAERKYLINNSFRIGSTATLHIKPGAHIVIYPDQKITLKGRIIAKGKPDSLIIFESDPSGLATGIERIASTSITGVDTFRYCIFRNLGNPLWGYSYNGAQFYVEYCIFENNERKYNSWIYYGISYFCHNILRNLSALKCRRRLRQRRRKKILNPVILYLASPQSFRCNC